MSRFVPTRRDRSRRGADGRPVPVFVSLDPVLDAAVAARFVTATHFGSWPVTVTGWSASSVGHDASDETRRLVQSARLVLVVCGPHTDSSASVAADVAVARSAGVPFLLVQGHRWRHSSRPAGVPDDEPILVLTARNLALVLTSWSETLARSPW